MIRWWESLIHWWHSINWYDPNWVGAMGQWAGAIGTVAAVFVALWLPRWERKRNAAERLRQHQEQQLQNARLVTVSVPRSIPCRYVEIFNGSDRPVFQPRIDSIDDPCAQISAQGWQFVPEVLGGGPDYSSVLPPKETHYAQVDYRDSQGRLVIWDSIDTNAVTITFMDGEGQEWRRTGHDEPVRVTEPGARSTLR